MDRRTRNRIVIDAARGRPSHVTRRPNRHHAPASTEAWVAISVIAAAALATFIALFLTSRPSDPMDSSVTPQQDMPSSTSLQPSPKPTPSSPGTPSESSPQTVPPEPSGQTIPILDDAGIQAEIERRLAADASLSGLDASTIVEGGKVTLVGSVRSPELKTRIERVLRSIKGVIAVDNQLVVTEPTP